MIRIFIDLMFMRPGNWIFKYIIYKFYIKYLHKNVPKIVNRSCTFLGKGLANSLSNYICLKKRTDKNTSDNVKYFDRINYKNDCMRDEMRRENYRNKQRRIERTYHNNRTTPYFI